MSNCKNCKPPVFDIQIIVPEEIEIGSVEIFKSDEDIYDSLPFTDSEKQELKDELAKLIADQEDMV